MRNGWNWKYPLSYMYPAYTQLVAKCSSPSIDDARATGCARDSKYKFVPLSSIRRAGVEPFLPNYHMDWVVLGFRWVDGWVPLTTTMCVIPPSYQALSGSYPNHQTSSSTGESQVRPPLTAYQVRVYENNSHSRGHHHCIAQLHCNCIHLVKKVQKFLLFLSTKILPRNKTEHKKLLGYASSQ